jgi:HD-like signal output (HDOD) protein
MTNTATRPVLDPKKILAAAQLPALPQSAIRLLQLSQDPENGPAEFTVPIEADPGLASQVLRFVNSSYFGFSREISAVKQAITLVGVRTVKNFALWSAVFSLMPNPRCGPLDLKLLWQDSLRRALFARHMVRILGKKDAEEVFAAALLQDMAIPLLAKESPALYTRLLQTRGDGNLRLSDLEKRVFGWTHADVGAMMARQWNLPELFAELVENHIATDQCTQPETEPRKLAVMLSSLLPALVDPCWHECATLEARYKGLASHGSPELADLLGQIDQEHAQLGPLLKLSTPAKSLVDSYHEAMANVV